jgi:tetratricopeptide (TPR) repeat protein
LSFLLNLNNYDIFKNVKIAILLYKLNLEHFFDYITAMEKQNKISILLQILDKLKLYGDTKNTIRIIKMIIDRFDSKSEEYLKLYETLCDMTHLLGQYEKASNLLEKLVNTVEKNYGKNSKLYIKYSIRIAHHRMFFSNIDLPWDRILNLSNEVKFDKYKNEHAEIMFMLGGNLAALKGNFREGIDYLNKTIEIGKKINDKYLLSRCMRKLSDYYRFYNDMNEADSCCQEGIAYTDDEITNRQRIYLFSTQAENFRKHGKFDKAIKYFEYCKELSLDNNIKGWVANSILGLSETYRIDESKQHDNNYLLEALSIYEEINMNWGIIHTKIAMALNNEVINKKMLNEAFNLAIKSNYSKDIKYIQELLKSEKVTDLSKQHSYHELMFL